MTIRIAIVDERPLFRAGVAHSLEAETSVQVVGHTDSPTGALVLVREHDIDVLVLGLHDALDSLKTLREKHEELAVLVVAQDPHGDLAAHAVRMGARGVLDVKATPEVLVEAVRTVAAGRRYLSVKLEDALIASREKTDRAAHEQLSEREFQVFIKLARGSTAGDVARELSLSLKTVGTYRNRVMEKMRLKSNSDLTYYAMKNGLLQ
jgi:two-component system, NarL family, invasion response regulator UvrY